MKRPVTKPDVPAPTRVNIRLGVSRNAPTRSGADTAGIVDGGWDQVPAQSPPPGRMGWRDVIVRDRVFDGAADGGLSGGALALDAPERVGDLRLPDLGGRPSR